MTLHSILRNDNIATNIVQDVIVGGTIGALASRVVVSITYQTGYRFLGTAMLVAAHAFHLLKLGDYSEGVQKTVPRIAAFVVSYAVFSAHISPVAALALFGASSLASPVLSRFAFRARDTIVCYLEQRA